MAGAIVAGTKSRHGKRSTNSHKWRRTTKGGRRAHSGCPQEGIGRSQAKGNDRRCAYRRRKKENVGGSYIALQCGVML